MNLYTRMALSFVIGMSILSVVLWLCGAKF
jgi:hypothetical protein